MTKQTDSQTTLVPKPSNNGFCKPDFERLKELSPVFRKLSAEVQSVKADEQRYRETTGYVPSQK